MASIRRVLVVQPYGIGDLLFLTPVLRALRLIPTVEKVDLLLGSRTEAVVRANPHVDEIMTVDKDLFHRRSFIENTEDSLKLFFKLRRTRYDLLLDYSLRGEYGFACLLAGISRRAGFNYKRRGFFHNIKQDLPEGFKGRHVADFVCDLAEKAQVPVQNRFLEFYLENKDQEEAGEILQKNKLTAGRYLVISAGGGESWGKDAHFKQLPIKHFAQLLERIKRENGFEGVIAVGSTKENPLIEELAGASRISVINLAGKISLGVCAAVIKEANLFMGNDGGLLHIAHAMKTPVIGFYGPVDPGVYGPYPENPSAIAVFKENLECRPCYQKFRYNAACVGRECLQELNAQEIMDFLNKKNFFSSFKNRKAEAGVHS